jgi:2',3'-cyclic-nucleotide 2'-phosphodiesterase (5'-nucleotidase family)
MPRLLTSLTLAAGMALAALSPALAEKINVTIITASDMDTMGDNDGRGGVARLGAVVKGERDKGGNVIFVFPGDLLSPSILAGFDKGEHMVELLNQTPPDMLTPGNHEYDFGPDVFLERMSEANFPKLGTNTRQNGEPIEGFTDTIVKEYKAGEESLKVGFMGLTTDTTPTISSPGNITFLPMIDTAKSTAAALREEGVDIVVAVVHTAQQVDFDLLYQGGVDIVLSGHDHHLHVFYDGRVALVESKEEAEYVTMMDLEFDVTTGDRGRRVRWWPNFRIQDTAKVEPDPDLLARVAAYEETLSTELDVELGTAEIELDTRRISVRTVETVFGNMVADAMRKGVNADIAFTNGGGIRGNKQYDAGHVLTRRDILTELPFGNGTVLLEASGAQVLAALEHGYRAAPEASGSFLHVSGLTAEIDTSKDAGSRVSGVMVNGEPLDPSALYKVATNDFMARGGDGYSMLPATRIIIDADSADLMANDVMVFVKENGGLDTGVDGRLTIN